MRKTNIIALVLCLVLLYSTIAKDRGEEPAEPTFELLPATTTADTASFNAESYLDSIIFLGDSTTYGLKSYSMLSGGEETQQVWTPASGTLTISNQSWATITYPPTGQEIPIRDAVSQTLPEVMVITLGANGVSFLTEDGFTAEYRSLVSDIMSLSPDTRIVMHSIYPVEIDYPYLDSINNQKITAANGWIKSLAAELGVTYIDSYSLLLDSTGNLNPEYGNGDGIHLSPAGFTVVLDNLADNPV